MSGLLWLCFLGRLSVFDWSEISHRRLPHTHTHTRRSLRLEILNTSWLTTFVSRSKLCHRVSVPPVACYYTLVRHISTVPPRIGVLWLLPWSPPFLPVLPYISHRSTEAPPSCVVNDSPAETSPELQRCVEWLQAYFSEPQTTGSLPLPAFHHPALQGGLSWINICRAMTGIRLSLLIVSYITYTHWLAVL